MTDAISPLGMDPQQIRLQLSRSISGKDSAEMSSEAFSQLMWQTVIKDTLSFEGFGGGESSENGMYADMAKETFSSAIAAQLALSNPLPMPGASVTEKPREE